MGSQFLGSFWGDQEALAWAGPFPTPGKREWAARVPAEPRVTSTCSWPLPGLPTRLSLAHRVPRPRPRTELTNVTPVSLLFGRPLSRVLRRSASLSSMCHPHGAEDACLSHREMCPTVAPPKPPSISAGPLKSRVLEGIFLVPLLLALSSIW